MIIFFQKQQFYKAITKSESPQRDKFIKLFSDDQNLHGFYFRYLINNFFNNIILTYLFVKIIIQRTLGQIDTYM